MAARCYLSAATAASVAPTADAGWERTTGSVGRMLLFAKSGADTLANGSTISGWTLGTDSLDRQYVSEPINELTFAGTVKMQLRSSETLAACNTVSRIGLRVVSGDGTVVRGTMLAVADYAGGTELASAAVTNKTYAVAGTALTRVDARAGDRIVLEVGYSDNVGVTPNGKSIYGSSAASDLPEDETTTTNLNPWIEFSDNIAVYVDEAIVDDLTTFYRKLETAGNDDDLVIATYSMDQVNGNIADGGLFPGQDDPSAGTTEDNFPYGAYGVYGHVIQSLPGVGMNM